MTKTKRALALLLAVAVIFVLFSSSALIVLHADHDCIGEGCEICELLCVCAECLRQLAVAVIVIALAMATFILFHNCVADAAFPRTSCTLVTLRVKLSN